MRKHDDGQYGSALLGWKIILKYFFKYFLGLLAVLVLCIFIVFASWSVTRREVMDAGQVRFEEGMTHIAEEISKMRILENDIQDSTWFQTLSRVEDEIPWGDYMALWYAMNHLKNSDYLYAFSRYRFVLFKKSGIFTSSAQCSEFFDRDYYGRFLFAWDEGELLSAEQFRERIFSDRSEAFSFFRLEKLENKSETSFTIQSPVMCVVNESYALKRSSAYATVYVIPRGTLVSELLTEDSREGGFIRITDEKGKELLAYGRTEMIREEAVSGTDIGGWIQLYGEENDETGWHITVGIPESVIAERMNGLYRLIFLYIVIGLLVVILLSTVYGRKQYQELKAFIQLIPEQELPWDKDRDGRTRGNEYEELTRIFRDMAENSERYRQTQREQVQQDRSIRIENLIVGGVHSEEERAEFERAGLRIPEYYCVAVVRIEEEDEERGGILMMALKEYLEKERKEAVFHIHTGLYDELFVVPMSAEEPPTVQKIQGRFEEVIQMLADEFGTKLYAGLSAIGTGETNLQRCYVQARWALDSVLREDGRTIDHYRLEQHGVGEVYVTVDFAVQLYQNVVRCNEAGTRKLLTGLEAHYQRNPAVFESEKEQIFFTLRNVLANASASLGIGAEVTGQLPGFARSDTPALMAKKLGDAADRLMEQASFRRNSGKEDAKDEVMRYLQENIADPNMSVTSAMKALGVTERFLQQVIRERTGDTFAVCLEKMRVRKAAELLKNTDMSNEQVAEASGFVAISTFYRAFNKRMGMSPKAFRDG